MALPPLEPYTGPVYACWCGNEFIDSSWLDVHQRTAHLPDQLEETMTQSRSSDATFASAVKSHQDFAAKVAEARKDGKNAS